MSKTMKAKELAQLCDDIPRLRRRFRLNDLRTTDIEVENQKSGTVHILSDVRADLSAKGTPTFKIIHVTHDGDEQYVDGGYEFEVVALRVRGKRIEL